MTTDGPFRPEHVIPAELAREIGHLPYWFVIGGHAVRCLCPYRPSRDVDFGVSAPEELDGLLAELSRSGSLEIRERSDVTVHAQWNGIDVSVFVVPFLKPFISDRCLDTTGILATKLHAILDRGTRRDFFDLYVVLQTNRLGILGCLRAISEVYQQEVNDGLLLRALAYFDDADREAPLPGEGPRDWEAVKAYFSTIVAGLLVPPIPPLAIQARRVDVEDAAAQA